MYTYMHTYKHTHTHTHTHTHIYIYIYTHISLIQHTILTAAGYETCHLTPHMSNIQSIVNIIQFKNNNYVHNKIKFKTDEIVNQFMP